MCVCTTYSLYDSAQVYCVRIYDGYGQLVCMCVGVWLPSWEGYKTWKGCTFVFAMTSLFVHSAAIIFKGKLFNLYTIVCAHTCVD